MELLIAFAILLAAGWIWYLGQQFRITRDCKYKENPNQPGQACVICPHNIKCTRARKSQEYLLYRRIEALSPEEAKKLWNDVYASENADSDTHTH